MLVAHLFRRMMRIGTLEVLDAHGRTHRFAGTPAPHIAIRLHDPSLHWRILVDPKLCLPEAYMDGRLTIERGDLYGFIDLLARNLHHAEDTAIVRWGDQIRLWAKYLSGNDPNRARKNVAHHYDLSGRLYELFLDRDRQYSCAYFLRGDDDIETAQLNKKRHIAAKLLLQAGQRVLDIGSGWGGMALHLAREFDVEVLGVTLSKEQFEVATERAKAAGLQHRVRFEMLDYREVEGTFDRIVSVGMFEHVGVPGYPAFFRKLRELLKPDGVALLHAIGRMDGPGSTNPWLKKYIFPGGYSPALSEVLRVVEKHRLWVADIEILRLHYAETLKRWRARFNANREVVRAMYDERFCRMWELYLVGSELAFRRQGHMVFQMQLTREQDAVPITRNYLYAGPREAVAAA